MSYGITQALVEHQDELMADLTTAHRLVLITMASFHGASGCFPSDSRLAKLTSLSRNTVAEAKAAALKANLIEPDGNTYRRTVGYEFTSRVRAFVKAAKTQATTTPSSGGMPFGLSDSLPRFVDRSERDDLRGY